MDLENVSFKIITNEGAKCGFCNKKLKPIGLDYLYANVNQNDIEYERCDCSKAIEFWKEYDLNKNEKEKQRKYREIIDKIYKDGCIKKKFKYCNFLNCDCFLYNADVLGKIIQYTHLCIDNKIKDGVIIYGKVTYDNTDLAASIANEIIRNNKVALMERTGSMMDKIKETFNRNDITEAQIVELYSNVNMLIIDDFGSEIISNWALEKLYKIVNNRYENELPIVITTKYNKEELLEKLAVENEELAKEFIQLLYRMCYGISLTKDDSNTKEKVSISDQTIC